MIVLFMITHQNFTNLFFYLFNLYSKFRKVNCSTYCSFYNKDRLLRKSDELVYKSELCLYFLQSGLKARRPAAPKVTEEFKARFLHSGSISFVFVFWVKGCLLRFQS